MLTIFLIIDLANVTIFHKMFERNSKTYRTFKYREVGRSVPKLDNTDLTAYFVPERGLLSSIMLHKR